MVTSNKNGKKKESLMAKSLQGGDSVTYVSRPRRKPDVTTKGKLNEWSNGFKEFIPQGQKASNRNMLKQLGNSSYYKSEGGKVSILTELDCNRNIERMLLQAQAQMNVCIGRHRTEILNNEKKTTD